DHVDVPAVELRAQRGQGAELGGADRGEVLRVGKQDGPAAGLPGVELDRSFGGVRDEIRRIVSQADSHCRAPRVVVWPRPPKRETARDIKSRAVCRDLDGKCRRASGSAAHQVGEIAALDEYSARVARRQVRPKLTKIRKLRVLYLLGSVAVDTLRSLRPYTYRASIPSPPNRSPA